MPILHGAAYQGYLNERCVTIAEALRGGYRTAMVARRGTAPALAHRLRLRRIFRADQRRQQLLASRPWPQFRMNDRPYTPEGEKFYMTDAFTDRAVEYIDKFARVPGSLLSVSRVHGAALAAARLAGRHCQVPRKIPHWLGPDAPGAPRAAGSHGTTPAQIDRMDQGIGRVLRQVRQTGQEDNTLIVFLADNGGCHEERIADEQVWVAPGPGEPARTLPARVIRRHIGQLHQAARRIESGAHIPEAAAQAPRCEKKTWYDVETDRTERPNWSSLRCVVGALR